MSMTTPTRPMERTVETIALTETSWRACDADLPDDDATRLIAYIEKSPSGFEVLWMWPSVGVCDVFPTFDGAIIAVGERLHERRIARAAA